MNDKITKFIISNNLSVREGMKHIDSSHNKILFVVDSDNKLYGSLTDGDIRRWILSGNNIDSKISDVCNKSPLTIDKAYDIKDVKMLMTNKKVHAIPIISDDSYIVDILFWDSVFGNNNNLVSRGTISLPVVIMAGGIGSRLDSVTKVIPKPLIPIGDSTIIEIIINNFIEYAVSNFFISIHYKSKMIKAFFEELSPNYNITYLEESKPLGTAGALAQLSKSLDNVIVTNCDTIINCDYNELVKFHMENNFDITVVGSMISHLIPYGICEIDENGKLLNILEKPEQSHIVNTGMYIISKRALGLIPQDQYFDMTDLIGAIKIKTNNIGVYPITENSWIDTGQGEEYRKALEFLNS